MPDLYCEGLDSSLLPLTQGSEASNYSNEGILHAHFAFTNLPISHAAYWNTPNYYRVEFFSHSAASLHLYTDTSDRPQVSLIV